MGQFGPQPDKSFGVENSANRLCILPPMTPNTPSSTVVKKTRWLLYVFGSLAALLLVVVVTLASTVWWIKGQKKPGVLSTKEKGEVEEKLQHTSRKKPPPPASNLGAKAGAATPKAGGDANANQEQDRPYVPGSKVLKLTEREVNGLLNANTDLGKSVRLEFAKDAINAYVVLPIPQDFSGFGGK